MFLLCFTGQGVIMFVGKIKDSMVSLEGFDCLKEGEYVKISVKDDIVCIERV